MNSFFQSESVHVVSQVAIGGVWVFHGLYSKILDRLPRHRLIVGKILGQRFAGPATKAIGCLEVLLGVWVWIGVGRVECASLQTLAIIGMNALEILFASELLISAVGMVALNLVFLAIVWHWALNAPQG